MTVYSATTYEWSLKTSKVKLKSQKGMVSDIKFFLSFFHSFTAKIHINEIDVNNWITQKITYF